MAESPSPMAPLSPGVLSTRSVRGVGGEGDAHNKGQSASLGALRAGVQAFLRGAPARGRVFLISDYWQEEAEVSEAAQRLAAGGFELTAFHVLAAEEALPPEPGELRVLSPEEPGEVELNVNAATAAR